MIESELTDHYGPMTNPVYDEDGLIISTDEWAEASVALADSLSDELEDVKKEMLASIGLKHVMSLDDMPRALARGLRSSKQFNKMLRKERRKEVLTNRKDWLQRIPPWKETINV